jgi:hypothetical protein
MPTTQKSPQKQTKATQKVGGSAKKPVTKAMEGGKVATPMKTKTVKEGGGMGLYDETKRRSLRNEYLIKVLLNYLYKRIEYKQGELVVSYIELGDPELDLSKLNLSIFDKVMNGNLDVVFHDQDQRLKLKPASNNSKPQMKPSTAANNSRSLANNNNMKNTLEIRSSLREDEDPYVIATRRNVGYGYK